MRHRIGALSAVVVAATCHAQQYTMEVLPDLPGIVRAVGIDDLGRVAANQSTGAGFTHPTWASVWEGGDWVRLPAPDGAASTFAYDISTAGIAGAWSDQPTDGLRRAAMWPHSGGVRGFDLGPGSYRMTAINNHGELLASKFRKPSPLVFVHRDGSARTVSDDAHWYTEAAVAHLNDSGDALYQFQESHWLQVAVDSNGMSTTLGVPTEFRSALGSDISEQGHVIGEVIAYTPSFRRLPAVWRDGVFELLPTDDSGSLFKATAISDRLITGYRFGLIDRGYHAVLWHDGGVADLDDLHPPEGDRSFVQAVDINGRGQILAVDGRWDPELRMHVDERLVVLSPIPAPASGIPLLCGLFAAVRRRR